MPDAQLHALLGSLKLGSGDISEIQGLAKGSNYQMACQKHFDVTHPGHMSMVELKVRVFSIGGVFFANCMMKLLHKFVNQACFLPHAHMFSYSGRSSC
jgi:hypothetical protein